MSGKELAASLLKKQIPDRMGLLESYWYETLKKVWVDQGYPKGANPHLYFDHDIVPCVGYDTSLFFGREIEIIEEADEWRITRDQRSAILKKWKNKSGTPEHIGFEVKTPEIWKKYRDSLLCVNLNRFGKVEDITKNISEARKANKFILYTNLFIFEIMRGTIGDADFLPALLEEPQWIRDFCQVHLDNFKMNYEAFFREVGLPDGMFVYEDFGFRNGLFCSPATLKELIMPYEKALISFFKDYNLPVILHSCGDIRKAIPLIIDAGFDCLQPMEAKAGMDVVELAKTYGNKLCYMGNIDVVTLNTNDPVKIKEEIVRKMSAMREMKIPYFFHSDHSIPPTVDLKTYQYMLDIFRENCIY